jgi:hypothetical protein
MNVFWFTSLKLHRTHAIIQRFNSHRHRSPKDNWMFFYTATSRVFRRARRSPRFYFKPHDTSPVCPFGLSGSGLSEGVSLSLPRLWSEAVARARAYNRRSWRTARQIYSTRRCWYDRRERCFSRCRWEAKYLLTYLGGWERPLVHVLWHFSYYIYICSWESRYLLRCAERLPLLFIHWQKDVVSYSIILFANYFHSLREPPYLAHHAKRFAYAPLITSREKHCYYALQIIIFYVRTSFGAFRNQVRG